MLVLPTYTEGVPNVILEAMASRLPVLTTPVGGIPSVATDEVNCVMVKPGDVAGLGAGICRLLRDDALCERLAAAGLREVSEKYGLEVVADQVRQIYRRALQAA